MLKFDSLIKKVINVIYENLDDDCEFKSIFNVQLYGEKSVIAGELAIFKDNSFSLIDNDTLIFKILQEVQPYLKEIQKNIGDNNDGNIYLKLKTCDLQHFSLEKYIDKDEKLEVENYVIWEFDELNMIQFPEDKFTIKTLKKFNRIK